MTHTHYESCYHSSKTIYVWGAHGNQLSRLTSPAIQIFESIGSSNRPLAVFSEVYSIQSLPKRSRMSNLTSINIGLVASAAQITTPPPHHRSNIRRNSDR
jgi:hypothetical protein